MDKQTVILPLYVTGGTLSAIPYYKLMGIIEVNTFYEPLQKTGKFILPVDWHLIRTNHAMYKHLVDASKRIRATIFNKSTLYDCTTDVTIEKRYGFKIVNYLPQNEKGHFKTVKIKKHVEQYSNIRSMLNPDYSVQIYPPFILEEEEVFIPKYKNHYQEIAATPFYFEITDNEKVIFSSKDKAVFFTTKYRKNIHEKYWNEHSAFMRKLYEEAESYLNDKFPMWQSLNAYWD